MALYDDNDCEDDNDGELAAPLAPARGCLTAILFGTLILALIAWGLKAYFA